MSSKEPRLLGANDWRRVQGYGYPEGKGLELYWVKTVSYQVAPILTVFINGNFLDIVTQRPVGNVFQYARALVSDPPLFSDWGVPMSLRGSGGV